VRKRSIDEICDDLKETYNIQEERITTLEEELDKLRNEKWKDKQLQEMKKDYDEMQKAIWRGFPISEEEGKAINEWSDNHIKEKHLKSGYILPKGACYKYIFTPTSIGIVGEVECSCGEKFVFQDLT
jgi:hypothetical protein